MTHIASALIGSLNDNGISDDLDQHLDMDYLKNLGIDSHLDEWKQITLETFHAQETQTA